MGRAECRANPSLCCLHLFCVFPWTPGCPRGMISVLPGGFLQHELLIAVARRWLWRRRLVALCKSICVQGKATLLRQPPSNTGTGVHGATPTQGQAPGTCPTSPCPEGCCRSLSQPPGPSPLPSHLGGTCSSQVGGAHVQVYNSPLSPQLQGLERRPRPKGTNEALGKSPPTPPGPTKATQGALLGLNAKN